MRTPRFAIALTLLTAVAACTGQIGDASKLAGSGSGGASGNATTGGSGSSGAGGAGGANPTTPDVNRVDMHRLNNGEYDNTIRDLLGVKANAVATFIADEKALGFDNIAAAAGMTDARYEQYFNSADALTEQVFVSADLRGKIVTCTSGTDCIRNTITAFGAKAWRRPLETAEVDRLVKIATDATALGEDFLASIKQVVKTMLASAPFLYRLELDADPTSTTAHPLNAYELASRLSYLVWSTMPDDELRRLAAAGDLLRTEVLQGQLARMLADARSRAFVESFAGQWLGLRDLQSHQVDVVAFPTWNDGLRAAMVEEGLLYFTEFFQRDVAMTEFLTADVNFVTPPLATLYGMPAPASTMSTRVTTTTDERQGFLGLASFLTLTSFSYRTAPTLRGAWMLEHLLCAPPPPPPAVIPPLDPKADDPNASSQNVRKRLEAHRTNSACASCHQTLDPLGLGLENFDGIGKYRKAYANGDAVDATGELPSGATFNGVKELSALLAADGRFTDCASKKLMIYALSREIVASDEAYLRQIRAQWQAGGWRLRSLIELVVLSEPFRNRRGEGP